jgi:hypothetical protein
MRTDLVTDGDEPIKARALFNFDEERCGFEFRQGDSVVMLVLPGRMHSCAETLARVFNECMDAGPDIVQVPDCENPDTPPELVGGQYIGLTRDDAAPYPFRNVE